MSEYFDRQIKLIGSAAQSALRDKSVLIVGCGGLGSAIAYALGSLGLKQIYLLDDDTVCLSNIHRQIAFNLKDIGKKKVKVVKKRIEAREGGVRVKALFKRVQDLSSTDLAVDLILDATDNNQARLAIEAFARGLGAPWIYAAVERFEGRVAFFDKASFSAFSAQDLGASGVGAPMVMEIAAFSANLAFRYLAGLPIKKDVLYYVFYDEAGEKKTQIFNLPKD